MGYVMAKVLIEGDQTKLEEVDFLADSGSFHPIIPPDLAQRLALKPMLETELTLADKRKVKAPLLGVTVLEGLGIRIDPATGRLEYSRSFGLAALEVTANG